MKVQLNLKLNNPRKKITISFNKFYSKGEKRALHTTSVRDESPDSAFFDVCELVNMQMYISEEKQGR